MSSHHESRSDDSSPRYGIRAATLPTRCPSGENDEQYAALKSAQDTGTPQQIHRGRQQVQAYHGLTQESRLFALCYLLKYTQEETTRQVELFFRTSLSPDAIQNCVTTLRREGSPQHRLKNASRYPWYPSLTSALAQREFIDEEKAFIVFQACRSFSRQDTVDACQRRFDSYQYPDSVTDILRLCRKNITKLNILKETAKIYPWYQESPSRAVSSITSDLQVQQRKAVVSDEQRAHWALQRHYGVLHYETLFLEAEHTTGLQRNESTEHSMRQFHSKLNKNYAHATEWVQRARGYPWWREDTRDPDKVRKTQDRLRAQADARQRIAAKKVGFGIFHSMD